MCDFRSPPTGVQDVKTQEIYPAVFQGNIGGIGWIPTESGLVAMPGKTLQEITKKNQKGFYYICGSGCYYSYWNGEQWFGNFNESLVNNYPKEKWAQRYLKYKFLFPKEFPPCDCL